MGLRISQDGVWVFAHSVTIAVNQGHERVHVSKALGTGKISFVLVESSRSQSSNEKITTRMDLYLVSAQSNSNEVDRSFKLFFEREGDGILVLKHEVNPHLPI
jgi:hypothetical protein